MAKFRPVTDEEIARMAMRIDDVQASANELARRLKASNNVPLAIDRAMTILGACAALNGLAAVILRGAWLDESRVATKAAIEKRIAEEGKAAVG